MGTPELKTICAAARSFERAAHQDDAVDSIFDAGFEAQGEGYVRERADGDERDLFFRRQQGFDDEVDGAAAGVGGRLFAILYGFELAGFLEDGGVEEGFADARQQRDVLTVVEAEFFPGELRAIGDVAEDGGDSADIEFGGLQGQGEGNGVVDVIADVGVEDYGDPLL
jgi:hypothetical protein